MKYVEWFYITILTINILINKLNKHYLEILNYIIYNFINNFHFKMKNNYSKRVNWKFSLSVCFILLLFIYILSFVFTFFYFIIFYFLFSLIIKIEINFCFIFYIFQFIVWYNVCILFFFVIYYYWSSHFHLNNY